MRSFILWTQKLRKTNETYIFWFSFVWTFISYTLFGTDCFFIVLFTKQVFIFPKIYIVYFTKHQRRKSSVTVISYSDVFEIYKTDNQMLEAISSIKHVNKKKVTTGKIVAYLNNAGGPNWNKESVEANLKEMLTKSITNENYKPLITFFSP